MPKLLITLSSGFGHFDPFINENSQLFKGIELREAQIPEFYTIICDSNQKNAMVNEKRNEIKKKNKLLIKYSIHTEMENRNKHPGKKRKKKKLAY